jgi:protein TonB
MRIKSFSIIVTIAAVCGAPAMAAPPHGFEGPAADVAAIVPVQSVKERDLEHVPPVDRGRAPPPAERAGPPAPPPRLSTRTPPPAADDDGGPPSREVPPPPTSTSRYSATPPPPQVPAHRADPRSEEAPPARRADTPRRAPTARSAFYANCTQQCHLSCEASFEACNGDSSPASPACVKKLESCRVERCACRID